MVITRSQVNRTNEKEQMNNTHQESDHEKIRIEQRFFDMNRQIGGLTSMVKTFTETMTDIREENGQNVQTIETLRRSDNMYHM